MLVEGRDQGFPAVAETDSVNKQGIVQKVRVQPEGLPGAQNTAGTRPKMATRLLLFIKFGVCHEHVEFLSADKFLLK